MAETTLPSLSQLNVDSYAADLEVLLEKNLNKIMLLLEKSAPFTWENLMHPLEDIDDALERFWSPLSYLHAVVDTPAIRACYRACLPRLSAYESAIGHNDALYEAIKSIDRSRLNTVQAKIVEDSLRGFELSGVALDGQKKKRFEVIQARLAELSNLFENNLLDSTQAFALHIEDEARLAGLPEHALHHARALAEEKEVQGWILTLEFPCYLAVVTYAQDRKLREEMYKAYVTRASDQASAQLDNSPVMDEILALRHEKAQLLGFKSYADLSLATKMAESGEEVLGFLRSLSKRAHHQAETEFESLQVFASQQYQIEQVEPWDVAYLSEAQIQLHHSISQEELRPYFPLTQVFQGLFTIVQRLFGMTFKEVTQFDKWHKDALCYEVIDARQKTRGFIYADLFARSHKRGGAWMDSCQSRRLLEDGKVQLPVAMLTCNFAKPAATKAPTLSHDEVVTLFHEMGHCLHHVLTNVDYLGASGMHGLEWDAVELPSQFLENWCWHEDTLQILSSHIETGEPLPHALYSKLLEGKNFQSAMALLRQLEFSIFDFRIHQEFDAIKPDFIAGILAETRKENAVVPIAAYNRFQHGFSHIFAGGYAAGYYSYKWAEVLSCDAFARFEEEGIFSPKAGTDFLHCILEAGSSKKAADAYEAFRGRPATVDALLRQNGIH